MRLILTNSVFLVQRFKVNGLKCQQQMQSDSLSMCVCACVFVKLLKFSFIFIFLDSSLSKMSPCSEAGKPCNPCLDAAKACNLNETCKRLRSAYNSICSKATPPQPATANQEPCSKKRCQKALRQFFERVSWELSYPLLFCSCPDQACAERRRRTIVPSCSYQERHKPSCLELRHTCRSDALCRSRLADFHMNCQMTPHTVTSCPYDNYNGCLMSYVGLIGSDVTPNYSDNSPTNITISLWCSCRSSGHQEQECDAFHRDFTHNTCLTIWKTRKKQMLGQSWTDAERSPKVLVEARLKIEHAFYELTGNLDSFRAVWGIGQVLCLLDGQGSLKITF
uniref:GDNF family receptor alpha 2b n=1 Tax=Nothobranchius furzeri TaxID=105023 RepID=A0A8C6KWD0_NOTFU